MLKWCSDWHWNWRLSWRWNWCGIHSRIVARIKSGIHAGIDAGISNGFRSVQTRYRPTTRPKIEFHGSVGIELAGTDHRVGTKAVIPRYRSVRVHSKLIPSRSHRSLIFKYPTGYRSCQWWCRYSRHLLCTYIRIHEQGDCMTGVVLMSMRGLFRRNGHRIGGWRTLENILSAVMSLACIEQLTIMSMGNRDGNRSRATRFGSRSARGSSNWASLRTPSSRVEPSI